MTFKDYFSGHATSYAQARPSYPLQLFEYLASLCGETSLAWDCATGNGQSAVALAAHFARVVATDGSYNQIAEAQRLGNIDYRVAVAEESTIPSGSVDLVTVSQALHWFDLERFFAVVDDVLKPAGVLAVWSYGIHSIDPAVDEVVNVLYRNTLEGYWTPERDLVEQGYKTIDFPFESVNPPAYSMSLQWTRQQVEAYLRSWSAVQKYQAAKGVDPVGDMSASLQAVWGEQDAKTIEWPLTLIVRRK